MIRVFSLLFLAGLAGAAALMLVTWFVSVRLKNAGFLDAAWAAAFAPLTVFYALKGWGYGPRKILIAAMTIFWSLRLAGHILARVVRHHPAEDPRYGEFRSKWGGRTDFNFFFFFEFQAFLASALSVPMLLACLNTWPEIRAVEWAGFALWCVALGGEALADRQLARFRSDPANRGQICQEGLWRWSRHPNYFFEWLVWCGYFAFALGSPYGFLTIYCPLLMLHFLVNVTGIKLTEEHSLKSKGDAYRRYQETTSAFVPWFRKEPR